MEFFPLFIEVDAIDVAASRNLALPETAHEHIVFPIGKFAASVERQTGNGNCRNPENNRRFHVFLPRLLRDARSQIESAEADHGPSVIPTRLQDVDFIAAVWSGLA